MALQQPFTAYGIDCAVGYHRIVQIDGRKAGYAYIVVSPFATAAIATKVGGQSFPDTTYVCEKQCYVNHFVNPAIIPSGLSARDASFIAAYAHLKSLPAFLGAIDV